MNLLTMMPSINILQYTSIIVLCLICYGPAIPGSTFVFDDFVAIVQNNDVTDTEVNIFTTLYRVFRHDFWGSKITDPNSHKSYRPLVSLSFNIEYRLFEETWFRLQAVMKCTNLVLHCAVCCLLFTTLKLMFKQVKENVLYVATILFAIHPVHTEAVSGIVGRAELLCCAFYLLTFKVYHGICSDKPRPVGTTIKLYTALFLSATASLLCKEFGIMALPFCMVYDMILYSKLDFKKRGLCGNSQRRLVTKMLVLGLATVALFLIRMSIMDFKGPKFRAMENPVAFADTQQTKILSQNYLYVLNIWLLLCPDWLSFDWSFGSIRLVDSLLDVRMAAVLLFYIYTIIIILKKSRTLLMMYLWIIIPFFPSSGVLTLGFVIAERILYIPSTGFCILVSLGWDHVCSYGRKIRYVATFFMVLLCAIFVAKTLNRSYDWMNEHALFKSALHVCPNNAKVFYNIARLASYDNDTDKAHDYYLHAISLYPTYDAALMNLGNLYRTRDQLDLAEEYIERSIKATNEFPAGWMNLGIIKATKGLHAEALHCYNQALKYKKRYPNALYNLGNLYLAMNNTRLALHSWTSALNIVSNHSPSWVNLLTLLDAEGQYHDVVKLSTRALEIFPSDPSILFIRANSMGKLNRYEEAEILYLAAIAMRPTHVMYHVNLGVLYHRWDRKSLAADCYNKALALKPDLENVRKYLQMLDGVQMKA